MRPIHWTRSVALALIVAVLTAGMAMAVGSKKKDTPKDSAETIYNAGVDLMHEGDFAGAVDKFEAALEEKKDWAEAHNNLAYSLRKQGADNYKKALKHYNKAISLKPDLAEAYHYRGVLHALQGDQEAAKADHGKLLELDVELADALRNTIASGEEPEGMAGAAGKWQ